MQPQRRMSNAASPAVNVTPQAASRAARPAPYARPSPLNKKESPVVSDEVIFHLTAKIDDVLPSLSDRPPLFLPTVRSSARGRREND
jgi:hypothetical protein